MAKTEKPMTKSELFANIANRCELTKKQVAGVFEALGENIKDSLGRGGCGAFVIPGLVKIEKKKIPAKPAQKNWRNPFTGELQDRPAKPASTKVKVRALKNLKDMV